MRRYYTMLSYYYSLPLEDRKSKEGQLLLSRIRYIQYHVVESDYKKISISELGD